MRPRRAPELLGAAIPVVALALASCTHDWSLELASSAGADASADRSGPPDAGGFTCEGALLCDTFEGRRLEDVWDDVFGAAAGSTRAGPAADARSPPNVLFAERTGEDGAAPNAYLTKVLRGTYRRARMELDVFPEQLDVTGRAVTAGIVFADGTPDEHKIRLAIRADDAILQEVNATVVLAAHPLLRAPKAGVWSHVSLAVEVGGQIEVTLDGQNVLTVPTGPSWVPSTATRVVAGINFVAGAAQGPVRLRLDNVRVDGS